MTTLQSDQTMSRAMKYAHRYHDWVFSSFRSYLLNGTTIEVGSGHGGYTRLLASLVKDVIITDIDPHAIEKLQTELSDLPNVRFLVMDGIQSEQLPHKAENIVLINVLEHIERDAEFLAACSNALVPGGRLIIFAPAFPCLYGRMDKQAGHFRRYTRKGLRALLQQESFQLERLRYINAIGFFGWLINKWIGSAVDSSLTNAQVSLYDKLVPIFKYADCSMPFIGQSVLAIAAKPR